MVHSTGFAAAFAVLAFAAITTFGTAARAQQCPTGDVPCGVSHCSPEGDTCCASAGDESQSCPAGQDCIASSSGVVCGGGGSDPGAACNGYAVCGTACTNAINPVCCSSGLIAPTEADCNIGSSSSGCTTAGTHGSTSPWGDLAMVGLAGVLLLGSRKKQPRP